MLTKTNRISRIFQSASQSARRPSYISPRSQLITTTHPTPSKYPSGVKPGQPGLQARPITSPNAIGRPQTVPAVNCGENAPVHQAQPAPLSLLIRQDRTAQRQG